MNTTSFPSPLTTLLATVIGLTSLGLSPNTHAGFSWVSSANMAGTYPISGGGQGIINSVAIGGTSSGGNPSHALQGVDVRYEAYDVLGSPLFLAPGDLTFNSDIGGTGQDFLTNIAIDGYIKVTYDFARPWVSNQSSGVWDPDVIGAGSPFGIESQFVFNTNATEYDFTHSWWDGVTQLNPNLPFLSGQSISSNNSGNTFNTIGTGFDGTGTGNYMHGTHNAAGTGTSGDFQNWHGSFNLDPYANQYTRNEFFIFPNSNAMTNGSGDPFLQAGTQFGITTNGAILDPALVIPEPSRVILLMLATASGLLIRRRR